ncbi:MAG: HAMP domain-containing sensor histidine kinase [Lachnospiraceae bacterium]|nr:HAMP domain-containing sensor histidine kinase [Lachnospiraceae bacterium]
MSVCILVIISILFINIIISGFVIRWYRNKTAQHYQDFLRKTDEILSGKPAEVIYDESLDSAVLDRLNRIAEIFDMQKEGALRERDTIKSLLSNISHQIRTPLTNITLYAELLKDKIEAPDASRLAEKIEKNAQKLEFFLKELLKSSYAEEKMISVSPAMIELDVLLKKSCQSVELEAIKKNIRILSDPGRYIVYADPKWTEEVFGNIIENAIKYSPAGSDITVKTLPYESFVCVRIEDHGIGIPEQEQGKVFQRFYRGTNVTDKQGFGIGLYLAREVLRKQQGYIRIKSELKKGTVVEVFLSRDDP